MYFQKGYTALTIAAEQGYSQFIQFFLSLNGIEIDKQTKDGDTPLMLAVLGGHNNVVNDLITSGSDIMLENKVSLATVFLKRNLLPSLLQKGTITVW